MTDTAGAPEIFRHAVSTLVAVRPREEVRWEEIRPPQRLAPFSYALEAEVTGAADEFATGRLIVLHDPDGQQAWHGVLRLVAHVRAELDAEQAADPMLPEVGWSWLTESLDAATANGASWTALGGTVTRTSSARFGDIVGPSRTDDLELRASWTAIGEDLAPHGEAFYQLLANVVGLPPVGVTLITPRRGA